MLVRAIVDDQLDMLVRAIVDHQLDQRGVAL